MIAILVVGHLQAFIDPAINVVIHVSDSKSASWVTVNMCRILLHVYICITTGDPINMM